MVAITVGDVLAWLDDQGLRINDYEAVEQALKQIGISADTIIVAEETEQNVKL